MQDPRINLKIIRIVIAGWLFGWFCKYAFYAPYLTEVTYIYPVWYDFFPSIFLNNHISVYFYFFPSLAILSLALNSRRLHQCSALIMLLSAAVMNLHINTYNDATFVTSFWVALWLLWFSFQKGEQKTHACLLAQLIIAMVFLGGFVGKLTPEYWSGEIIYKIFIEQAQESPVNIILEAASDDHKRLAAAIISKMIIGGELLLAVNILMPTLMAFSLALVIMPILMLFSTWKILSVISCLIGLSIAGIILNKRISIAAA